MTDKQSRDEVRARAIDRLPTAYAVALRLRDAGAADGVIAAALDVDLVSLPALLDLAEAKLAAIRRSPGDRQDRQP